MDSHHRTGPQVKIVRRAMECAMLGVSLFDKIRDEVIRQRTGITDIDGRWRQNVLELEIAIRQT